MWDFLKKFKKTETKENTAVKDTPAVKPEPAQKPAPAQAPAQPVQAAPPPAAPAPAIPVPAAKVPAAPAPAVKAPAAQPPAAPAPAAPKPAKPHAEKTDDELAEELNAISPEILAQAKNPEMRKMVINIYRKMLLDGVDVNNDKEVKKWLKKHPEVAAGGEAHKIETVKRTEPKVGRNDPCYCGSGKKYKKCHGAGQ